MTYWLVNAGTTQDPLSTRHGGVRAAFANWDREHEVHGVDRNYGMQAGDVLVYRTVGHPVSRLVAHAEVLGPPRDQPVAQWAKSVPRRTTAVVDTYRNGPLFEELGLKPVRMTRRLDDETGARAVALIDAAVASPRTR
jgi:hypothetical protein